MDRRGFLKKTAAAPASFALASGGAATAASDRVNVALIGCGGMGSLNLTDFQRNPEPQIVAVCDVFRPNAERARTMSGGKAEVYSDFRRVLERKDVDAVIIATPDHWHALMAIEACNAGKDVYVEKPASYCVREGRLMVEAARRNKRIVQVGQQQRSGTHFQRAVKAVWDGRIGKVHYAQCWNHNSVSSRGAGKPADAPAPPEMDWDMFLGPAPQKPYNPSRRNFRLYFDYNGGELTNWGTHLIDIVHWAMKVPGPLSATASGGNYHVDDCRDTPDTLEVLYEYPGFLLRYSAIYHNSYGHNGDPGHKPFGSYGILLHGTLGTLFINRAGYEITPQAEAHSDQGAQGFREAYDDLSGSGIYYTQLCLGERSTTSLQHMPHVRNFLDCLKSRALPAADIEIGHQSAAACHLGNIAYRTGTKIRWDSTTETIANSAEASKLLTREYRPPWRLAGL